MDKIIKLALNLFPRTFLIRASYIFRKISRFTNRGNDVECPVCGSHYKKFLSYGYQLTRQNALCPKCLSLERHRLVWLFLKEKTGFFTSPMRVLHIAPEQPFLERFRKLEKLDYVTADLESPLADYKCDVQDLPFRDNEFDMVICNHVLEHVDNDRKAMSELLRVLKPEGEAILLVPIEFSLEKTYEDPTITSPKERTKHFKQYDHVRLYGRDFPQRLKEAGFTIPAQNYTDDIPEEVRKRYALPEQEFMYGYKK
ncbi:MAG: class I SAM-dependent methyltransferase [Bacteroidales bacterium]|nr:class I SAM-dependent methyltransferase [Bacteroidales bacterium]